MLLVTKMRSLAVAHAAIARSKSSKRVPVFSIGLQIAESPGRLLGQLDYLEFLFEVPRLGQVAGNMLRLERFATEVHPIITGARWFVQHREMVGHHRRT